MEDVEDDMVLCVWWERRYVETHCTFLPDFAMNLKLLLKMKFGS